MEETNTTPKGVSMKKILVSLAAAAVLVVGVATTAVITGSSADAQEAPDSDSAPAVDRPEPGSAVQEVLDDLVAANEITQAQADTIFAALQEKREELKANRPEGGHGRGSRRGAQFGMNLAELLEDGVIDAAELAELPEGHPFNNPDGPFADALVDGQITAEEIQEIRDLRHQERQDRLGADVEGTNV